MAKRLRKTIFIKNAVILTGASLLLRFAGIIFKVWLAAEIGSEGIGLYQLIFSFYVLASTFATSGISTAVTRLVAEESALGSKSGILKILHRAISITLLLAVLTVAVVYFSAETIAVRLIGDKRAVAALKILPFSLPFMGISSCYRGYFIAREKVTPNVFTQIMEQILRILLCLFLVKKFASRGLSQASAAVMAGDVFSEILGFVLLYAIFFFDKRKLSTKGRKNPPFSVAGKIVNIALPITSGRYLNSILRTFENVLVPKTLSKHSLNSQSALSQFGMIKGMALPILFFPSAILNAVSTLLIPEISRNVALGRQGVVKESVRKILKLTSVISFVFAAIFLVAGDKIGLLIYKEKTVGFLIKALAPIVPFMYLDSISDGILKGLDQQRFTFKSAISDSVIRILLIISVVKVWGLIGFIGIMYFSNFLTCFLNVGRLLKVSGAKLDFSKEIVLPILLATAISFIFNTVLERIGIENNLVYIIFLVALTISGYFVVLLNLKIVSAEMFNIGKKKNLPC